uniref:Multimerin 1 n=1 Tax=Latimeria chalumnae TaxID=7897 RepID=H3AQ63_LATCH
PFEALTQKMNEQIYSSQVKLTLLQKKVDNISANMNDVQSVLFSLEGKINEEKGKDSQSTLKGTENTLIQELVKELVKEQLKAFKENVEETIAQLFKTVSSLSEELQSTRETMRQLNETMATAAAHKVPAHDIENQPTTGDVQELRDQMEMIRNEITVTCGHVSKELTGKHESLEAKLQLEYQRSSGYYESINRTLSQIREVHEQLLSGEFLQSVKDSTQEESQTSNLTEHVLRISETVRKQGHMMLQLYDAKYMQDAQINNLTSVFEHHRNVVQQQCQEMFYQCKNELHDEFKEMKEYMHSLNKTLTDSVIPMDDMMHAMDEKINDLAYDMEILQPVLEQRTSFNGPLLPEHHSDILTIKKQLEGLTSFVNHLRFAVKGLVENQEKIKANSNESSQRLDKILDRCRMEIEDGLNDTMTVLNVAIDSIKDSYYLLESNIADIDKTFKETYSATDERLKGIITLIPQFLQLNDSLLGLLEKSVKHQSALEGIGAFSDLVYSEHGSIKPLSLVAIYQILNETVSRVESHQHRLNHLEETALYLSRNATSFEARIQTIESKLELILSNPLPQSKKDIQDQPALPKSQDVHSRIKEMEAKSANLTKSLSLLKQTSYGAWSQCRRVSVSLQQVNASVSQLAKSIQPNFTMVNEAFKEFVQSFCEARKEDILTNVTLYVQDSLSSTVKSITKLQKQMKQVLKKQVAAAKKNLNSTTTSIGRSLRNTDNTLDLEDYESCISSPCQNGGTCINERKGFVCACRAPFGGANCSEKLIAENVLYGDFSKGSYRYAPMVTFFAAHTYGMNSSGPIKFNHLYVNYGASYAPGSGKFLVPYLGVYVFKYTIESCSPHVSGFMVVDGVDKLAFQSEDVSSEMYTSRVVTGDAVLELNYGQRVWLRLVRGSIPAKFPPVTTFGGYLLYRT